MCASQVFEDADLDWVVPTFGLNEEPAMPAACTKRPLARCCGAGKSRERRAIGRRNLLSRQLRRRSAIRPNPPIAINSQVDGSGTALTETAPSEPKDASGELGPETMMP